MPTHFLLYAGCTRRPGALLGDYLGIPHGIRDDMPSERLDYLIRYGCISRVRYVPRIKTANRRDSIAGNTNKFKALQTMAEHGISVPPHSLTGEGLDFPVLARDANHMRGRDIRVLLQPRDLNYVSAGHYVQYVPKRIEWRVHVGDGRILDILEKCPNADDYDPVTCSHDGWRYRSLLESHGGLTMAIGAVAALQLDFGAVDIVLGEDDKLYVLEVNTAPGFTGETRSLRKYADMLCRLCNIEREDS